MKKISFLQHTLKALADPTRRDILEMLKEGKMSAGNIAGHFHMTNAAISRHLSILREADLIRDQREGKFIFYEINLSVLEELLVWVGNFQEQRKTSARSPNKRSSLNIRQEQ